MPSDMERNSCRLLNETKSIYHNLFAHSKCQFPCFVVKEKKLLKEMWIFIWAKPFGKVLGNKTEWKKIYMGENLEVF